jgi:cell division septation protein DedD
MKNREFRELQVSSTQLAIIFFGILIIGVVIFLLGVSVGKKHAQASLKTSLVAQKTPDQTKDKLIIPESRTVPPAVGEVPKQDLSTQQAPLQAKAVPAPGTSTEPPGKSGQAQAKAEPPATKVESSPPAIESSRATAEKTRIPAEKVPVPQEAKKPEPRTETSPSGTAAAPKKGLYYVQVGALATKPEASSLAQKYRAQGYTVLVLDPTPGDKKAIYRVRVGGFASRAEAEALRVKLASAAGRRVDFFIVRD